MSFGFSISGASEEEYVLASGGELSELIEGIGLSLSSLDSVFSGRGEFKSADSKSFGDVEKSDIVGDGTNNGDNA